MIRNRDTHSKTAMTAVLIVGGYGTFGRRIASLLAADERLRVIVAGRDLARAQSLAARFPRDAGVSAARFDRDADVAGQLAALAPHVVVDASGPFGQYGADPLRVARAAVAQGRHYVDLADDPGFVCSIRELNDAARANGVFALSGASTCPALSGAVVRYLARDMASIRSIGGGIAPSPRLHAGIGVIRTIAGMAGQPAEIVRNGRPIVAHAFIETRRATVAPPGCAPLPQMTWSLVRVPDLVLFRELAPQAQDTWFGAAPTPAVHHALLRLLARLVRLGLVPSLRPLAPLFKFAMRRLVWGRHRGGMFVTVCGENANGRPASRAWHLVAEGDNGPAIPAFAAVLAIRRHLDGVGPAAGARTAHREFELAEFETLFDQHGIRYGEQVSANDDLPLFRRMLGTAFAQLPAALQAVHGSRGPLRFTGDARIAGGHSVAVRLLRRLFGLPNPGAQVPVSVRIETHAGKETWYRDFGGHRFKSALSAGDGYFDSLLRERFGPVAMGIALVVDDDRLRFNVRRWRFLGIPLPLALAPQGEIFEQERDGRFAFHVEMRLPLSGHLVTYAGTLEPETTSAGVRPRPGAPG